MRTLRTTLYTQGCTHTPPQAMTLLLSSLCAVEERLCQRLGENPQLPWDSGGVSWYGCAWHDKNSQGETAVTTGYLPHYKVLNLNGDCFWFYSWNFLKWTLPHPLKRIYWIKLFWNPTSRNIIAFFVFTKNLFVCFVNKISSTWTFS